MERQAEARTTTSQRDICSEKVIHVRLHAEPPLRLLAASEFLFAGGKPETFWRNGRWNHLFPHVGNFDPSRNCALMIARREYRIDNVVAFVQARLHPVDIAVIPPPAASKPPSSETQTRWFTQEVHAHEASLRSYLRGSFPAVRDIDDVVQESYLRVWRTAANGTEKKRR